MGSQSVRREPLTPLSPNSLQSVFGRPAIPESVRRQVSPSEASKLFSALVSPARNADSKPGAGKLKALPRRRSVGVYPSPLSCRNCSRPVQQRLTAENLACLEVLDRAQAVANATLFRELIEKTPGRGSGRASPAGSFDSLITTPGGENRVSLWQTQKDPVSVAPIPCPDLQEEDDFTEAASCSMSEGGSPAAAAAALTVSTEVAASSSESGQRVPLVANFLAEDAPAGPLLEDEPPADWPVPGGSQEEGFFGEEALLGMLSGQFGGNEPQALTQEPLNGGMVPPEWPEEDVALLDRVHHGAQLAAAGQEPAAALEATGVQESEDAAATVASLEPASDAKEVFTQMTPTQLLDSQGRPVAPS